MGFILFREIGVNYAHHTYCGNVETGNLGDPGVDWMILKLMLEKQDGDCVGSIRLARRGSNVNTVDVTPAVRI
jgi:hypothetical protein